MPHTILPFRFKPFGDDILCVNDAGEWLFVPKAEFLQIFAQGQNAEGSLRSDLTAKSFITGEPAEALALMGTKFRTKKRFLRESVCLHMMVPTLRCDCSCVYCQVGSRETNSPSQYDMTPAVAMRTVDLIFQTKAERFTIEFQGGEPTLNFDVVKIAVLHAKRKLQTIPKHVTFVLCTNLLGITPDMLAFCRKHDIHISTSLDGTAAIHNGNRPSRHYADTHARFVRNLDLCRQALGADKVSALLTVTRAGLDSLCAAVDEYAARGFNSIFLRPLNPYGRCATNAAIHYEPEEFVKAYCQALDYIIKLNLDGRHFVESYARTLLEKMLTPFGNLYVDLQSPAGAGLLCALYNYDGNVYASDEGRMLAEMGDREFLLGTVSQKFADVFQAEKVRQIFQSSLLETKPPCKDCPYIPYCGVDPVREYLATKNGRQPSKLSHCRVIEPIFDHLFRLLRKNDRTADVLWSWVSRVPLDSIPSAN